MILLIDNYDSFTYNLLHYVAVKGMKVTVRRNDEITTDEALKLKPQAIILSPGPCDPDKAGICLELIQKNTKIPMLGVCLGHQAIGQAFGGKVIRGDKPMHGKVSDVTHTGKGIFKGIPSPFKATRYHSLIVERKTLPSVLEVTAQTKEGTIMGLQHKKFPIYGVQFHPESIASEHGHKLIENFIGML